MLFYIPAFTFRCYIYFFFTIVYIAQFYYTLFVRVANKFRNVKKCNGKKFKEVQDVF